MKHMYYFNPLTYFFNFIFNIKCFEIHLNSNVRNSNIVCDTPNNTQVITRYLLILLPGLWPKLYHGIWIICTLRVAVTIQVRLPACQRLL